MMYPQSAEEYPDRIRPLTEELSEINIDARLKTRKQAVAAIPSTVFRSIIMCQALPPPAFLFPTFSRTPQKRVTRLEICKILRENEFAETISTEHPQLPAIRIGSFRANLLKPSVQKIVLSGQSPIERVFAIPKRDQSYAEKLQLVLRIRRTDGATELEKHRFGASK